MSLNRLIYCMLPLCFLLLVGAGETDRREADQRALAKLQLFIGQWKGVGQVRRGSRAGAWIEKNAWAWRFDEGRASLAFDAGNGKFFKQGELKAGQNGLFELTAVTPGGDKIQYHGKLSEEKLVLDVTDAFAEKLPAKAPARITMRTVASGDRLIVLYESKSRAGYNRLAETGYTRQGSQFGKGASYVECVVTGGKGTIEVSHDGKSYYVCCGGCRDLFNEDPVAVLAEYKAKKKK